jgi:hypothetical protein
MSVSSGNKGVVRLRGLCVLSPKLPSFKRSILFSFLFLALLVSAFYLKAGYEIEIPSELDIAISSILEDFDSWTSRIGPSISWNGGSSFRDFWQAPSGASGIAPSLREESDRKSDYAFSDAASSSPPISLILDFDSSVSSSLFRTWGNLTFQGGSPLPYLILNATLWDGDRLVERTRYMMIEVEPGKSRDFDIRESCRLSPERSYSCLLEVEEPEELFASEPRDCLMVEDDTGVVIWDESGAARGREAGSEKESEDSTSSSGSAKVASTSTRSKSTETSQEVEDSPDDFEFEDGDLISDFSSDEQKKTETEVETKSETEVETDYEYRYVGSTTSNKYHRPDCSYAKKIKDENKIFFSDVEEAEEAGYLPCKVCNPQ